MVAGNNVDRKAEEHILSGQVKVNDQVVKQLGTKIDPEHDKVFFNGQKITPVLTEKKQ